jgi:hypothetical protein
MANYEWTGENEKNYVFLPYISLIKNLKIIDI